MSTANCASPVRYRELTPEDLEEVFQVRIRTWHNPHGARELVGLGITPASVLEKMRTTHRGWVALSGAQIVGFSMADRSDGELWVIAVLPEFEGRGIGRALLSQAEGWLGSCGWSEVWLTTDINESLRAVGFYRHLGWKDWKIERGDRFMRRSLPGRESSANRSDLG